MDLKKIIIEKALFTPKTESVISWSKISATWIFDFRSLLLNGEFCKEIAIRFWDDCQDEAELQLATLELAGVPLMSALIYEGYLRQKKVNGLIIRKSAKKYGLSKIIEGEIKKNVKTIVVDDLINSGASIEKCILNLIDAGVQVSQIFSILNFETNSFSKMKSKYKVHSHNIFTLSDFDVDVDVERRAEHFNSFQTCWVFDPALQWNKSIIFCKSNPVCDESRVFFGSDTNQFFCLDLFSGKLLWKKILPTNTFLKGIWSTPVVDENFVYFGSYDGGFYCLDKMTGNQIWENSNGDFIGSSACLDKINDRLFLGLEFAGRGFKGAVSSFKKQTGEMLWQYKTQLHVHSSPRYSSKWGMVFCGSNDSDLLALSADTGFLRWRSPLPGIVKMGTALSANEDFLAVGALDGSLIVLDPGTGNVVFSYKTEKAILATPEFFDEDKIIVGSCDKNIYIFNFKEKKLISKIPTTSRILGQALIVKYKAYVPNNAGLISEVDLKSHQISGYFQVPERVPSRIEYSQKQDTFFAHTCDDRIFSFKRQLPGLA